MRTILEIQKRIRNFYGIDSDFIQGDGTEFGNPNKLIIKKSEDKGIFEVDSKLGNSWYFPGCCGVNLITFGEKANSLWFDNQFRYIDQTGDIESIWSWFTRMYGKKSYINEASNIAKKNAKLFTSYGKKVLSEFIDEQHPFKIRTPNPLYTLVNPETDEIRDYKIIDITLPYPSETESMSLIIQVCNQTNELTYSFRALTKTDTPSLIRMDQMNILPENGFAQLIKNYKNLLKETYNR